MISWKVRFSFVAQMDIDGSYLKALFHPTIYTLEFDNIQP